MQVVRKDGIIYERKEKTRTDKKKVTIRLRVDQIERLKNLSEKKGIKFNEMIRICIDLATGEIPPEIGTERYNRSLMSDEYN